MAHPRTCSLCTGPLWITRKKDGTQTSTFCPKCDRATCQECGDPILYATATRCQTCKAPATAHIPETSGPNL